MVPDNWADRSNDMRCLTCMWFVEKAPEHQGELVRGAVLGRCRRHSPTLQGFPAVFSADWCGDHKLDETRI